MEFVKVDQPTLFELILVRAYFLVLCDMLPIHQSTVEAREKATTAFVNNEQEITLARFSGYSCPTGGQLSEHQVTVRPHMLDGGEHDQREVTRGDQEGIQYQGRCRVFSPQVCTAYPKSSPQFLVFVLRGSTVRMCRMISLRRRKRRSGKKTNGPSSRLWSEAPHCF
jgi:hypothetical protein